MNENNEILIRADRLSYTYPDYGESHRRPEAIREISLSVRRGEYIAVLGHNGSGKSTLAKLFSLILTPTAGKLTLFDEDVTREDFTEDDLWELRRRIGMVFQNPDNQLVATIVEEDIAFGPENLGLPREEIRRRVDEALETVGLTEYARHAPHKLSGGQKQRVAIAGIIAMRPEVMIFDESTAMLDPLGRREVIAIMEKLHAEEGITVLNITHNMQEAVRADRVIVMNDGEILYDGTPREVFAHIDELHDVGLEAPQSAELAASLRAEGIPMPEVLREEECFDELKKLFETKRIRNIHE